MIITGNATLSPTNQFVTGVVVILFAVLLIIFYIYKRMKYKKLKNIDIDSINYEKLNPVNIQPPKQSLFPIIKPDIIKGKPININERKFIKQKEVGIGNKKEYQELKIEKKQESKKEKLKIKQESKQETKKEVKDINQKVEETLEKSKELLKLYK